MWASQLYTVMRGANSVMIGVRLDATSNGVTLPAREVVIHIFNCPVWGIGAETITVRYSATFPNFFGVFNSPGSVSLTNIQNCDSLTRVSIPLITTNKCSHNKLLPGVPQPLRGSDRVGAHR